MSILDRFDPVFTECLGCLCHPPYPFAICVAQTIDEATIKANILSKKLYEEMDCCCNGNNLSNQ